MIKATTDFKFVSVPISTYMKSNIAKRIGLSSRDRWRHITVNGQVKVETRINLNPKHLRLNIWTAVQIAAMGHVGLPLSTVDSSKRPDISTVMMWSRLVVVQRHSGLSVSVQCSLQLLFYHVSPATGLVVIHFIKAPPPPIGQLSYHTGTKFIHVNINVVAVYG